MLLYKDPRVTTYAVAVDKVVPGCAYDPEMWEAELQQHLD